LKKTLVSPMGIELIRQPPDLRPVVSFMLRRLAVM
jgi:hypothetical protein